MTPREPAVLPAPLTPPDCDLQDFKFMPLDVARLRDSDMASEQTPEENWAAVLLWAAAWHQVPAGSMPDSDNWIAKAAGYLSRGRIDPHWQDVRDGAMRGFVLCSDGRWYHPVVCEKANESWIAKLHHSWKKECDRIRKANKQREAEGKTLLPFPPEPTLSSVLIPMEGKRIPPENRQRSAGNDGGADQASGGASAAQQPGTPPVAQDLSAQQHGGHEIHASNALPLEKDEFPPESTGNSNGSAEKIIGNPLENALKGQGQGEGQGQLTTKTWSSSPQASTEVGADDDSRTPPLPANRNVQIALLLRAQGIQATSQNPVVCVTWAQNPKVTDEVLNLAIAKAKAAKGDKPIPLGYLFPIVEQELQAQDAPPPDPTQQKPRDSWEWKRTPGGIEAKGRELGMFARGTETHADFAKRIEAEIVKRKGGQP